MANNRMYIRHKKSGKELLLAKYYPNTGWYMFHNEEKLNLFFDSINSELTMLGDTGFDLYYETDNP